MPDRTYLTTTFREKDKVKALGARWDGEAGRWYVPEGRDLQLFAAWLPEGLVASSDNRAVDTTVKGVPLSRLLGGVATTVARAFSEGIWTTAEVVRASSSKGHYYLELSERSPDGEVLAQARGVIWARVAQTLLAEFKRATGADLDAGIKVLLRAKPVFKPQFGFSLEIDGVDPSYTLGDLEARKRDIRERLKREGLFDRNRLLPAPWDFTAVLAIAPEHGAGLGDFAKEAQRLEQYGVCEFSYSHSRFQGEGAAGEILEAISNGLTSWSRGTMPDAVVIIRGGGAVNDLAWLNDYALARFICESPVPVLTGIGHERDDTSIDEVAHRKFDTPSKVIAGIEDVVRTRARDARSEFEQVIARARTDAYRVAGEVNTMGRELDSLVRSTVVDAGSFADAFMGSVREQAVGTINNAKLQTNELIGSARADARAQLAGAGQSTPTLLAQVQAGALGQLGLARTALTTQLPTVLERISNQTRARGQSLESAFSAAVERAQASLQVASDRSQALVREITGQGPQKTLRRGFAVVRSSGGKTITGTADLVHGSNIEVNLRDGIVGATVQGIKRVEEEGG